MDDEEWTEDQRAVFTLALVETCFRNTELENLHAGRSPRSVTGDFSDVKVVSPRGEIPWNELSRLSDEEMKTLMIEVVDKVYTFVSAPTEFLRLGAAARWNKPQYNKSMLRFAERRLAMRNGMSEHEAWAKFPLLEAHEKKTSPTPAITLPGVSDEMSPERLVDLANTATLDIDWVRRAREALRLAASVLEPKTP